MIYKGKPTHNAWSNMRARCNNPNSPQYKDYGGRGIKVCGRWGLFVNFLADMGEKPSGVTLERANNNLGYTPENCCWATRVEQANNKRNNRLTLGVTIPVLARKLGIHQDTLYARRRRGWNDEEIVLGLQRCQTERRA